MLHHRTTDPSVRAWHVAQSAAKQAEDKAFRDYWEFDFAQYVVGIRCQNPFNPYCAFTETAIQVYEEVLRYFCDLGEKEEPTNVSS